MNKKILRPERLRQVPAQFSWVDQRLVRENFLRHADPAAWAYQAFSCEYIANLLEQRERPTAQPGALHLTRQQDLLDLDLPAPDLSLYQTREGGEL